MAAPFGPAAVVERHASAEQVRGEDQDGGGDSRAAGRDGRAVKVDARIGKGLRERVFPLPGAVGVEQRRIVEIARAGNVAGGQAGAAFLLLTRKARGAARVTTGSISLLGEKQGLANVNVWTVAEASDGWLWLGTTKGLYRVGPKNQRQRMSVASGHLQDDWVMAIAPHGSSMWIGTYKGGVTRLDPAAGNTYQATQIGRGWINPGGLTWHGNTLHAATMDGHVSANVAQVGALLVAHPAQPPGRDTTAIASQGNRLWIASRRGLRVHVSGPEASGAD